MKIGQMRKEIVRLDDRARIENNLFAGEWADATVRLRNAVDGALSTLQANTTVRALWRAVPLRKGSPYSFLGYGRNPVTSRLISMVLSHCDYAVVCAATLGPRVDELIADPERSAYDRYIYDQTASVMMETAMDELERYVEGACGRDEALTARYSPGYCDWPLQPGQQLLFPLLDTDRIGITLTDSSLMQPRKSVTAVLGVGDPAAVREYGIACTHCPRMECPHRRREADLARTVTS